jgi:hypothetical protein
VKKRVFPLILSKVLYIINAIFLFIGWAMEKKEVETLYRDALQSHLLREGYSDYMAEVEAARRMKRLSEL